MSDAQVKAGVFLWGQVGEKLKDMDQARMITLGLLNPAPVLFTISYQEHIILLRAARLEIRRINRQKITDQAKKAKLRVLVQKFKADMLALRTKDGLFLGYADTLKGLDSVSMGSALLGELEGDLGEYGVDEDEGWGDEKPGEESQDDGKE